MRTVEFTIDYKITARDSLNSIYSSVHWAKRKSYADTIHWIVWQALNKAKIPREPFDGPVEIEFIFPPDKIDIDNHGYFCKSCVDAMKGWIIPNDNRKYVHGITQRFGEREDILVSIKQTK